MTLKPYLHLNAPNLHNSQTFSLIEVLTLAEDQQRLAVTYALHT